MVASILTGRTRSQQKELRKQLKAEPWRSESTAESEENMQFDWTGFSEYDFKKYAKNPDIFDDYIGCVRTGELCFDIVIRPYDEGPVLTYDLYVGGIDDNYGHGKDDYPYTYADGGGFDSSYKEMSYEEFQKMAEQKFVAFITERGWTEKANEPLHVW